MMHTMYEFAIAAGAILLLAVTALAAREKMARDSVTVPAFATASCAGCGSSVDPGEGSRIRGDMYCGDDCARWAW
ncbi:hypothetical protein U2G91_15525 [Rhodococcoides fascians]|uniref:hypothetical protein n=1 Tax=Rhodococcoides fascians TaxID=1828 RepID=UPI002ACD357F|nr:hypothetical protein [Rhodococcus fascians]WQH26513.1 hypothetical protein U2G91_15525 [Rhodococcus fascians]